MFTGIQTPLETAVEIICRALRALMKFWGGSRWSSKLQSMHSSANGRTNRLVSWQYYVAHMTSDRFHEAPETLPLHLYGLVWELERLVTRGKLGGERGECHDADGEGESVAVGKDGQHVP